MARIGTQQLPRRSNDTIIVQSKISFLDLSIKCLYDKIETCHSHRCSSLSPWLPHRLLSSLACSQSYVADIIHTIYTSVTQHPCYVRRLAVSHRAQVMVTLLIGEVPLVPRSVRRLFLLGRFGARRCVAPSTKWRALRFARLLLARRATGWSQWALPVLVSEASRRGGGGVGVGGGYITCLCNICLVNSCCCSPCHACLCSCFCRTTLANIMQYASLTPSCISIIIPGALWVFPRFRVFYVVRALWGLWRSLDSVSRTCNRDCNNATAIEVAYSKGARATCHALCCRSCVSAA